MDTAVLELVATLLLVVVLDVVSLLVLDVLAPVELSIVLLMAWTHPAGERIGPEFEALIPISTIITGHVLCIALLKTVERLVELKWSVMTMKGLDDARVEEVNAYES